MANLIEYPGQDKVIKRICELINTMGGRHTIEDESGTDYANEPVLQFKGVTSITDDSENEKTIVKVLPFTITENPNGGYDVTYPN